MKRFVSVLLVVLMFYICSFTVFASEDEVVFSVDQTAVSTGSSVTVTVRISSERCGTLLEIRPEFDDVFELAEGYCDVSGAKRADFTSGSGFVIEFPESTNPSGIIGSFKLRIRDDAAPGKYAICGDAKLDGVDLESGSVSVSVVCSHSYGEWASEGKQHCRTCSICGDLQYEDHTVIDFSITKAPTCLESGERTGQCSICTASVVQSIDRTDDHVLENCTDSGDGMHLGTCLVCGEEKAMPHRWDAGTLLIPSTCIERGQMIYRCTDCASEKTEELELAEHTWDAGKVLYQATCKDEGAISHTCTVCSTTATLPIEKLTTHKYTDDCDEVCNICDETRTGKHKYSKYWSMDQKEHWHQCVLCAKRIDVAAHQPGAAATETTPQICWLCKYVLKPAIGHEHHYSEELTVDETGHWYACSGCGEKKDYEEHVLYSSCDSDCAVCSYTRETEHSFSAGWSSDSTGHWHSCSECGAQSEFEAHVPGNEANEFEAQKCTVCYFEIVPAFGHTHEFSEEWITDVMHHWKQCSCGEKAEKDYHFWVNGVENEDGTVTFTCEDCGGQTITGEPKSSFNWLLLLILLIAASAAAFILIRKKKIILVK